MTELHQVPISKNTPITFGLVILVVGVSAGAIFKAGQVLTEFDYVKAGLIEIRSDILEIKRSISRVEHPQRGEYDQRAQQQTEIN